MEAPVAPLLQTVPAGSSQARTQPHPSDYRGEQYAHHSPDGAAQLLTDLVSQLEHRTGQADAEVSGIMTQNQHPNPLAAAVSRNFSREQHAAPHPDPRVEAGSGGGFGASAPNSLAAAVATSGDIPAGINRLASAVAYGGVDAAANSLAEQQLEEWVEELEAKAALVEQPAEDPLLQKGAVGLALTASNSGGSGHHGNRLSSAGGPGSASEAARQAGNHEQANVGEQQPVAGASVAPAVSAQAAGLQSAEGLHADRQHNRASKQQHNDARKQQLEEQIQQAATQNRYGDAAELQSELDALHGDPVVAAQAVELDKAAALRASTKAASNKLQHPGGSPDEQRAAARIKQQQQQREFPPDKFLEAAKILASKFPRIMTLQSPAPSPMINLEDLAVSGQLNSC